MNFATAEQLIAFEQKIVAAFSAGELPFLVHLSGGNERQLVEIFQEVKGGDWIFGSHRSHYHYLLAGGSPEKLEQLIRDGRSMFLFNKERNFITSSVLAGTCCIACGVALAIKQRKGTEKVWCFLGDGASDNGHFTEAARYAQAQDLPITFVVEDNDRQVDTSYSERWGTDLRMLWGTKTRTYRYVPTFPHGGAGLPPGSVTFQPAIVQRFTPKA